MHEETKAHVERSRVSSMAHRLVGSEILKIAADIRHMIAQGGASGAGGDKSVCNLTVGDFNPKYFPIPRLLETGIQDALRSGETNYPPSDGMLVLREAVAEFYERELGLVFPVQSIIVASGARPAIYGAYRAVVDPHDTVVYPVPSWNNNHYCHLTSAYGLAVQSKPEHAFLPTADQLRGTLDSARLLALCSPLNPTGTAFTAETLSEICDLVLSENARRNDSNEGSLERPLFLLYDQVYWTLTFGRTQHVDPVSLRPAMRDYTIYVDGISKAFAATGVRVGWAVAPPDIAKHMSNILGHVGAWAPKAEQIATAHLLRNPQVVTEFHAHMKRAVASRLELLYDGILQMRTDGLRVDAIEPMGAIYLTARFDLIGCHTPEGEQLTTNEQIRHYLLHEAGFAVVHFQAFGASENTGWFRLSVGAVSHAEIEAALPRVRAAIERLRP